MMTKRNKITALKELERDVWIVHHINPLHYKILLVQNVYVCVCVLITE